MRKQSTEAAAEALLEQILNDGAFDAALAATPELARTRGTAAEKAYWTAEVRTMARTCLADLDAMVAEAEGLLAAAPPPRAHEAANLAVNAFICAGRYREALAVEAWAEQRGAGAAPVDEGQPLQLQINLAEAEYNLGRWDEARRRLDRLDETALWAPLLVGGLKCQRAWMAAHEGDRVPAAAFLEAFDPDWLPPIYRAELYYCAAASHGVLGDPAAALEAVAEGEAVAKRASSRRNAHFLRAGILVARGEPLRALPEFESGAAEVYRGQGGDGLLAWGDCLRRLGREEEAAAAWRLAIARDPQSEAARKAAAALRGERR